MIRRLLHSADPFEFWFYDSKYYISDILKGFSRIHFVISVPSHKFGYELKK